MASRTPCCLRHHQRRGLLRPAIRAAALLAALGVLAACAPPTMPTAVPLTATIQPSAPPTPPLSPYPTWDAAPLPTPVPAPTAPPPWPTALPTPTAAPALNPAMQVATFFFYWHDCPGANCDREQAFAIPPGWTEPYAGDTDVRDGTYYSSLNRYWYERELRDMRLAGIDIVLPVSWGDHPSPWFRTAVLAELVAANRQLDEPLRIGLFDDTTSEASEYRDYADNQQFDGSTYLGREPLLDLGDPIAGYLFYDRKIQPFFQTIPQEMWATHNGLPMEQGGRPLIVVYSRERLVHLEYTGPLWSAVKGSFQRDFKDANGQPITPFVVLEGSWFGEAASSGTPPIDAVADARYDWGAALHGPSWHTMGGYTVASAGPGFDNLKANWAEVKHIQERSRTPAGQEGDPGTFLRWSLGRILPQTNLLLIETWNELWEGTSVCRAAYPPIADQGVPEDYYLDLLRRYLRGQGLWWAAQPLPPDWPAELAPSHSYRLALTVQNTGARTWAAESGERLVLNGDLFPGGYEARPEGPVRPGETGHFTVTVTTPAQAGAHALSWQMAGPEGAFGPVAAWSVAVGTAVAVPTLHVHVGGEPLRAGQPLTLTVELTPVTVLAEVRLQVRFDPASFQLAAAQPLPGYLPRSWQVQVDNDRGVGVLEARADQQRPTRRVAQLRLQAMVAGESGLWVEQVELGAGDGSALVPEALWVPLLIGAAP